MTTTNMIALMSVDATHPPVMLLVVGFSSLSLVLAGDLKVISNDITRSPVGPCSRTRCRRCGENVAAFGVTEIKSARCFPARVSLFRARARPPAAYVLVS